MKVPKQFHQFENEKAIIIVSGNESADIYFAQDGFMEKIYSKEEEIPHYSDREEFFETTMGRSGYVGSGSVYESKEDEVEHSLFKDLQKALMEIFKGNEITSIYILSAEYFLPMVVRAIPKSHKGKIKWTKGVGLAGKHPKMILQALQKEKEERIGLKVPLSEEARKILEKGSQKKKNQP